jgi:hypothetical protein
MSSRSKSKVYAADFGYVPISSIKGGVKKKHFSAG